VDDKLYKRDLQAHEMSADKMPHKSVRKFKRKERQRGQKICRTHLKGEQHGLHVR
jgi:hypothetical protein